MQSLKSLRWGGVALCTLVAVSMLVVTCDSKSSSNSVTINDDNWEQLLKGEWMVEFYAPWCPACRSLQPIWEEFAGWKDDLGIEVGQVDITNSPGLSGRFMITALPTIYHIKDGNFRQYRGARSKEDFVSFVEEKKYEELDPVPAWQDPNSWGMSVISLFYRMSMVLRNVLTVLVEEYGVPAWACYLLFGLLTIMVGLLLGLVLVCVIDFVYPPTAQMPSAGIPKREEVVAHKKNDDQGKAAAVDSSDLSDEEEEKADEDAPAAPAAESKDTKETKESNKEAGEATRRRARPRKD